METIKYKGTRETLPTNQLLQDLRKFTLEPLSVGAKASANAPLRNVVRNLKMGLQSPTWREVTQV